MRTLDHFGIPTTEKQDNESYISDLKLHVTDYSNSSNKIEYLRFEDGSQMHEMIQKIPHIAYQVENLEAEMKGKTVLVEPFMAGETTKIAFVEEEGIPVELMEIV